MEAKSQFSFLKFRTNFYGLRAGLGIPRSIGLDSFYKSGAVAQLGERLICIQEVAGSIPTSSTSFWQPAGPVAQLARAHP